jgi:hypothetical protein
LPRELNETLPFYLSEVREIFNSDIVSNTTALVKYFSEEFAVLICSGVNDE